MKKLIKKLKSKSFQTDVLLSIVKYNFFIFPFLWSLTLFFSLLESFTYSGFIHKHIFFGFQFFFVFTVLGGFLIRFGLPSERAIGGDWIGYYKILSRLNNLFFPIILSATFIASLVEQAHYTNYVFSKIHLQPKNLYWVCFVSLYLIILDLGNLGKTWFLDRIFLDQKIFRSLFWEETKRRLILECLKRLIILTLVFWVLVFNARFLVSEVFKNLFFITRHPSATYDEKMRRVWGDFYNYMLFVKQNTPEDAVIANPPPVPPWNNEGSGPVFNAFLYPRKYSQSKTEDINEVDLNADYILIAWGSYRCSKRDVGPDDESCHGWPRVPIEAEWIIYKKENSSEIREKFDNIVYNPDNSINKYAWGLIKIKK